MRHLDQILTDKKENDALLEKAQKRKVELEQELLDLHQAVMQHIPRN